MSPLSGVIEGGIVGHTDGGDNPPAALRYKIDLSGFVERHLCTCDHCREVSGAPIHDILVVTKEAFEITQGAEHLVTTKTKPLCRREHFQHTGCQATIYVDADGFDSLVLVHMPTIDKKDHAKIPDPDRIVFLEDSTLPGDFWAGLGLPMYEGWVGHTDKDARPVCAGYMPKALIDSNTIEGGIVEHSDGSDNPPASLRFKIDLDGFVERHLCTCDHCREVSGAPIHDILVVTKDSFEITQGAENLITTKTKPLCRREHFKHTGCQATIYVDAEGFDSLVLVHMPIIDKKDQARVPAPGRIVFLEDSTLPGDFWAGLGLPMFEGWVGHADTDAKPLGQGYMPKPIEIVEQSRSFISRVVSMFTLGLVRI